MRKTLQGFGIFLTALHPIKLVLIGYASYVLLGWVLLCLPFSQRVPSPTPLDHLFTACSAVSTTGLATVSTSGSYSLFGQIVILLLIQLGGMGYMTFSSFVLLSRRRTLSEARLEVGRTVFSLPRNFVIDKFIRSVIVFTVILEGIGTVALWFAFRRHDVEYPLWNAVFHSVSAFCTAGFSLYDTSLEAFRDDFWVNAILIFLSYMGALGFIVCVDVWRRITGKVEHVTLTTKIILHTTFWITLVAVAVFFVSEPSLQTMPTDKRLLASFFQVMTALTTVGFNTVPISGLSHASLLLVSMLMIIGASPSGTGGGLKSTTFSAIIGIIKSTLKGDKEVRFWKRQIPEERLRAAVATFCMYFLMLFLGTYLLTLTEQAPFHGIVFEAASALGTVGLSTGITATLSNVGKLIVTGLMFIGRLGPLTFGLALFFTANALQPEHEDIAI